MIVIKNGVLVYSDKTEKGDIAVEDGKIVNINTNIQPSDNDTVIDAKGCYVMPGMIDGHTHFDMDAGLAYTADTFKTGTKAAVVGGTTTVVDFATQDKGKTLREAYNNWMSKAKGKSSCNYRFHMAITDWNENTKKEMDEMKDLGVTSYKMYMAYDNLLAHDDEILSCLEKVKEVGGVLGVHCENGALINKRIKDLVSQGLMSPASHPISRPDLIEAEAISRLCYIAKLADYPVNIVHLSSLAGLKEVRKARENGQNITVETCPQYLLLQDDLYLNGFESAKYVMSPPLRKKQDNEALIKAIADGEVDTIATDHCSFNFKNDKEKGKDDFRKIPNGAPGVEHRLLLIYTHLVENGIISISKMTKLMSENPAKLYGMYPQKGVLSVGSDADIVIFDPNTEDIITAEKQMQNVDYTPYEGFKVKGSVRDVLVNGIIAVQNGKLINEYKGTYAKG